MKCTLLDVILTDFIRPLDIMLWLVVANWLHVQNQLSDAKTSSIMEVTSLLVQSGEKVQEEEGYRALNVIKMQGGQDTKLTEIYMLLC